MKFGIDRGLRNILAVMASAIWAVAAATAIFYPPLAGAQDGGGESGGQTYYGQSSGYMEVERLASRMERFMKLHKESVRNQMLIQSLLGQLIELEIKNAKNGRFAHISDSTYFDTRTGEIFKRPQP